MYVLGVVLNMFDMHDLLNKSNCGLQNWHMKVIFPDKS